MQRKYNCKHCIQWSLTMATRGRSVDRSILFFHKRIKEGIGFFPSAAKSTSSRCDVVNARTMGGCSKNNERMQQEQWEDAVAISSHKIDNNYRICNSVY